MFLPRSCGRVLGVFFTLVVAVSCAPTSSRQLETMWRPSEGTLKVVLMPTDVLISVLTVGGLMEPNAAWTQSAQTNIRSAIQDEMNSRGADFMVYRADTTDVESLSQEQQVMKLHEAVSDTIKEYRSGQLQLPHKHGASDWSLGSSVNVLHDRYGADYALFVFVRDSHSSGGRRVAQVAMAIVSQGRVALEGGMQSGFASLVDLHSGDVVWFNFLVRITGDFRNPEDARSSVKALLAGFPS